MRTTSSDPPRRGAARSACGLALVLALAHGTTGCAHQQLTDTEFIVGAVAVAAVVGGAVWIMSKCNPATSPCQRPADGIVQLTPDVPPPLTGLRASSGR